MNKRSISWILVLLMLVTMMPGSVFATSSSTAGVSATKSIAKGGFDEKTGEATITLTASGKDTIKDSGADVIVVVDESGSMKKVVSNNVVTCGCTSYYKEPGGLFHHSQFYCSGCGAWIKEGPEAPDSHWSCTNAVKTDRMIVARTATKEFASEILSNNKNRMAIVGFSSKDYSNHLTHTSTFTNSVSTLNTVINKMYYDGGTNYTDALNKAISYAESRSDKSKPLYVVMMSDGLPGTSDGNGVDYPSWNGTNQAATLKNSYNATIYTVGIGLSGTANALSRLSTMGSDGKALYSNVSDSNMDSDLEKILNIIKGEITTIYAGTDATMTDVINSQYFDYVGVVDGTGITTAVNSQGNTVVTWNIGTLTGTKTAKIKVRLKDAYRGTGAEYKTNTDVFLTFTNADGAPGTIIPKAQIGDPKISTSVSKYDVTYSYTGTVPAGAPKVPASQSIAYGLKDVAVAAAPTLDGYTFSGWTTKDVTVSSGKFTMPNKSVTFTGTWKEKDKFTVSYNAGAGTGTMKPDSAYVGSELTVKGNEFTAPINCIFDGWKDGNGRNVAIGSTLTGNTVLTAQWRTLEDVPGVKAEGYEGIYNGTAHGIKVDAPSGAKIEYCVNGTDWTETNPTYTNAMDSKAVKYRVSMKDYKTVEGSADVKIAKQPITVESGSLERVYDGKPLTASTAVVKGLAAVDEGKITATAKSTITDVGSISNAAVVNGDADLLNNYTVFEKFGTLTVTARPVTLAAKSATLDWTGAKLNVEAPGYDITGGTLAEGQTITSVTVSEGQTDPGEYKTTVSNAQIGTFTGNYDIKYAEGKLVIKQLDMSSKVKAEGYEGVYDGTAHGIKVDAPSGAKIEYSVENSLTNVGELTVGYTVSKSGYANVTGSKIIKLTARPVTLAAKSATLDWTGEKLNVEAPGYDITGGTLAEGQTITSVTVSEGQTDPGEYKTTVSNAQIGTFTGNYDIKYAEGKLVIKQQDMSSKVKAEGYEGIYNGTAHGIKVDAPSGAKIKYSVNGTDWTETNPTYTNAMDSKTVQYRVSMKGYKTVEGSADVKIAKQPITVESGSLERVYDGKPLTASTAVVKGLAAVDEGKITATANGTITTVGSISNAAIVNGDADLLNNYTVFEKFGTLTVTARPVTLAAKSATMDWTGAKLNVEAPGYDITGGTLAEGQTITSVTVSEGQTDPGEYKTTVSNAQMGTFTGNYDIKYAEGKLVIKQLDMSSKVKAEGYEGVYDGTAHGIKVDAPSGAKIEYSVENSLTNVGELTVGYTVSKSGYANVTGSKIIKLTARPVTLAAKSATLDWTGEKLNVEAPGYDITGGTLAEGQTITSVTVSEGQTDPGEYKTTVSNAQIGTFTGNYDIKYAEGKLVIKQLDMSTQVKATGYEGVYDGEIHGIKLDLPQGAEPIFIDDNGNDNAFRNAGKHVVEYTVKKFGYNDVTGSAVVTIKPAALKITADSAGKAYDGIALTDSGWQDTTPAGIVAGDVILYVDVTGSAIGVGSVPNVASNAIIGRVRHEGDSEISAEQLALMVSKVQKYATEYRTANPQVTAEEAMKRAMSDMFENVTENYAITYANGTLTITSAGGSHHHNNNNNNNNNTTTINDEAVPLAGTMELNKTDHFNYVKGYQDGNVKPLNNITREEVATIFYRLLTEPSRAMYFSQDENFSDIASNRWSLNSIATLANGKVLTGYENGTFGATRPITRAEFAAIASRFDSLEQTTDNQFSDVSNHWAKSYINSAAKKGWINGYEDGTFKPDQYITRAEAMTLINKVLERRVDAAGLMNGYKVFPDNKENAWYYYQVIEATNNHKYADRKNMSDMEKWTEILSDKTWNE